MCFRSTHIFDLYRPGWITLRISTCTCPFLDLPTISCETHVWQSLPASQDFLGTTHTPSLIELSQLRPSAYVRYRTQPCTLPCHGMTGSKNPPNPSTLVSSLCAAPGPAKSSLVVHRSTCMFTENTFVCVYNGMCHTLCAKKRAMQRIVYTEHRDRT